MADEGVESVIRANRGLAAILANIGRGNEGKKDDDRFKKPFPPKAKVPRKIPQPQKQPQKQEQQQGFDLDTTVEFSGWEDISSHQNIGFQGEYTKDDCDSRAGFELDTSQDEKTDNKIHRQEQDTDVGDHINKQDGDSGDSSEQREEAKGKRAADNTTQISHNKDEDVYGPKELSSWSDILEYNDDHDSAWFEAENKRLAEKYGGTFIIVKYTDSQPVRVGYYCELCFAEMNAKKSLESHCMGMKHLRKKNIWEMNQGKSVEEKIEAPPEEPNNKNEGQAGRRQDPPPRRGRSDRPRPSQGRPPPHPRGHYESRDRSGYGGRMGSAGRDYNRYYDDYDRRSPYGGGRYDRGRYDRSNVPYSDRQTYDDLHYRSRADSDPYPYERNKRRTPPPPRISSTQKTLPAVPLPPLDAPVHGPTGTLLKQLSDCEVRDEKDVDLASDVITMLLKGLSDFHRKQGSSSSVHLISEAQIKFDIMKELINVPNPEVSTWM
ncbi:uncharacterized protein LOC121855592 [Homarus americanus]|uniref:C2H2-type domain-containing protein n=1 Tax=Homarus americanus TaxID=6706 RepID=A0A8J5JKZ2_HOMAM|nr:uncharacterized protein LOC121855592 [Homarus americanus]KAG7155049.1 hypothetical protein Hamer_G015651 [Homarus americanus]